MRNEIFEVPEPGENVFYLTSVSSRVIQKGEVLSVSTEDLTATVLQVDGDVVTVKIERLYTRAAGSVLREGDEVLRVGSAHMWKLIANNAIAPYWHAKPVGGPGAASSYIGSVVLVKPSDLVAVKLWDGRRLTYADKLNAFEGGKRYGA